MSTIVLSAAGAALGSAFGPVGALVGRAVGAAAGYLIDQSLLRATQPDTRGPRLTDLDVQTSTEGSAIPRVYGRVRLSGQIIWATDYEEKASETSGGKGGPTNTDYSYFANFAVALCEGPIHRIARVWADGEELDLAEITMRVYLGSDDQMPDALIAARQEGDVPAYRGLAYVVFERLALEDYGNRIPQLAFEVIRVVDTLEPRIRAVTMIPGATEFGLATTETRRRDGAAGWVSENRHVLHAGSDIEASLDDLVALCPNLETVALVVTWFGDDLRAGHCTVQPKVEATNRVTSRPWIVASLGRGDVVAVSTVDGRPAFGGTPSDASVLEAIAAIKARGLKVTLYPLVMMDVQAGNTLPDPYGGAAQAPYPWRGRITCHPAPGLVGSPDKTAAIATDIAAFTGNALPAHFAVSGTTVAYSGPATWSYRRMVLHYARLAQAAGGVDAMLIGSELRGLTTLRSGTATYPFVTALASLAADVKSMLGSGTKVTYGADWSEWFGHQPGDGSGDVFFHLDPLWASAAIDAVGISAYFPLTDWRWASHLDAAAADTPRELDLLAAGLVSGEGYDWYYADAAGRRDQTRLPISDGAAAKPWVFRPKDLTGWWSNPHHNRPGGIEAASPTAWVPQSKPIWLTELGCPAVDLGANQPNVFPDAKSSEAALPWFARGARDDLMQRRHIEAVLAAFTPGGALEPAGLNPVSSVYGGPMVAPDDICLWTWDARPFPAFPALADVWSDGANWATGHWLNGRLGGASVEGLIRAVLADHGIAEATYRAVPGHVDGFLIDDRMSPRAALEPLLAAFLIDAHDTGTGLRFAGRGRRIDAELARDDLVDAEDGPLVETVRAEEASLPRSVAVTVTDVLRDHRRTTLASRQLSGHASRDATADLPVAAPIEAMAAQAETWLQDTWSARETLRFGLANPQRALEPGDIVSLDMDGRTRTVLIDRIEQANERRIEARSVDPGLYRPVRAKPRGRPATTQAVFGPPLVAVIDCARPVATDAHRPLVAATLKPWPGGIAVWRGRSGATWERLVTLPSSATMGTTLTALAPGRLGLWDRGTVLDVELAAGTLASVSDAQALDGANLAAIGSEAGWELIQFAHAELIAPATWRLTRLLRGQGCSEDVMAGGLPAGATFVLLDAAVAALPIGLDDLGRAVDLKAGPSRYAYSHPSFVDLAVTPQGRGLLPFAPAHLKARRDPATGDIALSWIRRSRAAGADSWTLAEVPLEEASEAYRLDILDGTAVRRSVDVTAPGWTYPATLETADFGGAQSSLTIRVAQVSATLGPGVAREAMLFP